MEKEKMLYEHYDEKAKRADWKESFANYAKEGEDEMMLPDSMDSEADELMDEALCDEIYV